VGYVRRILLVVQAVSGNRRQSRPNRSGPNLRVWRGVQSRCAAVHWQASVIAQNLPAMRTLRPGPGGRFDPAVCIARPTVINTSVRHEHLESRRQTGDEGQLSGGLQAWLDRPAGNIGKIRTWL